jgi:hypothetical protein
MKATFYNDENGSISYNIGQDINLVDAFNATKNNHFTPTKITMTEENSPQNIPDLPTQEQLNSRKVAIGKHSIEDIKSKHKIKDEVLMQLLDEGAKHELEHTDSYIAALAIAKDHVYERLDYYQRLKAAKLAKGGMIKHIMARGGKTPSLPKADKMFHLPVEMAVYVPSTSNVDKQIGDNEMRKRVDEVSVTLSNMFGGYTSSEAIGGYVATDKSLVNEKIIRVVSYSTKDSFNKNKNELMNKLAKWAAEWGQEAVGYEYEGDLYYIDAKYEDGGLLLKELTALNFDDF